VKAIQFDRAGGPDVMHLAEVPTPKIAPGMVLVKNRAIGINFADVLFRRGQYAMTPHFPDTPGFEAAGVIEAVGPGVEHLKPGMRVAVIAFKAYAEYCLAPAPVVIPIPEFMSFEQGAAFPIQVLTAWHMLHTSHQASIGQTVVVHSAAGGVGIVAIQIAKAAGARVIGTVSSESKRALAIEYGADEVINYATKDFADEVMRLTDGKGVDLILDAVGKPTFEQGLKCLKPFGHLIVFGRAGGAPDPLNLTALQEKSLKVSAFSLPTVNRLPDTMRRGIEGSFELMREGKVRLLIGKTFPLAQAADAHRHIESRESVGKLLLIP
jgi:NADPH:quinone reductase